MSYERKTTDEDRRNLAAWAHTSLADDVLADLAAAESEIERLRDQIESVSKYAIKLLGAMLCERHREEASKMAFSAFAEETVRVECHWCVFAEVERLRGERDAAVARLQELRAAPTVGEAREQQRQGETQ